MLIRSSDLAAPHQNTGIHVRHSTHRLALLNGVDFMRSCRVVSSQWVLSCSCRVIGSCHGSMLSDNAVQVAATCRSQTSGTISHLQHTSQRGRRRLGKHSGRLSTAQFQYLMLSQKSRSESPIKQSLSRSKQVKAPLAEGVLLRLVGCQRKRAASLPTGTRNETRQVAVSFWYIPSAVVCKSCRWSLLINLMQQAFLYHSALPLGGEARIM